MEKEVKVAILKTLAYGDIFNYPLKKEDLWRFLISEKSIKRTSFEKALTEFPPGGWELKQELFFLPGREDIVEKRIKRKKESQKKINIAKKIIQRLSLVPTVLFIGISGGLALENAQEKDDIDLFVITSKGSLWITRLILVYLLIILNQYRGRGKKESQKICLNMLIDETALDLSKRPSSAKASAGKQNLYTAHEIVQLKQTFDRNNTYNKFLSTNEWVLKFLPNSIIIKKLSNKVIKEKKHNYIIANLLNYFAKVFQLWYMGNHKTKETITDKMLAFHPFDYGEYILEEYNKRLKRYEI